MFKNSQATGEVARVAILGQRDFIYSKVTATLILVRDVKEGLKDW